MLVLLQSTEVPEATEILMLKCQISNRLLLKKKLNFPLGVGTLEQNCFKMKTLSLK